MFEALINSDDSQFKSNNLNVKSNQKRKNTQQKACENELKLKKTKIEELPSESSLQERIQMKQARILKETEERKQMKDYTKLQIQCQILEKIRSAFSLNSSKYNRNSFLL